MSEFISFAFIIIGMLFMLISAIGVVRLPDLYLRMSASTKSATLGVTFILLATAVHFGELDISSRAIATIFFVLVTAPVSAHMIARAAYFNGIPLWKDSVCNELEGQYDPRTHAVEGVETLDADSTA